MRNEKRESIDNCKNVPPKRRNFSTIIVLLIEAIIFTISIHYGQAKNIAHNLGFDCFSSRSLHAFYSYVSLHMVIPIIRCLCEQTK